MGRRRWQKALLADGLLYIYRKYDLCLLENRLHLHSQPVVCATFQDWNVIGMEKMSSLFFLRESLVLKSASLAALPSTK